MHVPGSYSILDLTLPPAINSPPTERLGCAAPAFTSSHATCPCLVAPWPQLRVTLCKITTCLELSRLLSQLLSHRMPRAAPLALAHQRSHPWRSTRYARLAFDDSFLLLQSGEVLRGVSLAQRRSHRHLPAAPAFDRPSAFVPALPAPPAVKVCPKTSPSRASPLPVPCRSKPAARFLGPPEQGIDGFRPIGRLRRPGRRGISDGGRTTRQVWILLRALSRTQSLLRFLAVDQEV